MSVRAVLINTYELGRQPFGIAQAAAWLRDAGHDVVCLDLAVESLRPETLSGADLVALHLPMHTGTRIALEALPRIRALAPGARLCAFGLYAPVNEALFRDLGVDTVLGGEFEPGLAALAERVGRGDESPQSEPVINLKKIPFVPPHRAGLPPLSSYASLILPDGSRRTLGFTEASRGCKHLCRHCPVVPVYQGRFRIVPAEVVMEDVRAQVAAGARHISFGDPDFLNGPTHALKLVRALHREFPGLSYDVTVKVEHIVNSSELLPELARTGCLFITTAVESVDDRILADLDKGHTRADFETAAAMLRRAGIAMAPTFVPFTPWTTLEGYADLLDTLVRLRLVENVPPVQLAIRLLVPRGSYLFRIPGFDALVKEFDRDTLGFPWRHRDPRVDALQTEVQSLAERAESGDAPRKETFQKIYRSAYARLGTSPPALPRDVGSPIPHHSEPWYCCAEPTNSQLAGF
ncbi:MAG TPA: CUAEP/CCAEP-tail radical SAM protein [Gammaproteobacteria bacterium]|nr:CUAEP/CCAEP-tail radical SAM protein [Gammaproteobacteria bacterium]